MTRKIIFGPGLLVLATIVTQATIASQTHTNHNFAEIIYHRSISEWVNDAAIDVIVIGMVISPDENRIIPDTVTPRDIQQRSEQNGGTTGYPVTNYAFQIETILKDTSLVRGDIITIVQVNDADEAAQKLEATYTPIRVGERAVLSLVLDLNDPTVTDNQKKYTVITQPEVRYRITEGKIELMPGEWQGYFGLEEFVKLGGMSEDDFIKTILEENGVP